MVTSKKHLVLALLLSLSSAVRADFQGAVDTVINGTIDITGTAVAVTARGVDYLLAPAACILAGQALQKYVIGKHLPHTPEKIVAAEHHIPGGSTARNAVTYFILGGALYKLLQVLVNSETTGEFMQTNMPQLSGLVTYLQATQPTDSQSGSSVN